MCHFVLWAADVNGFKLQLLVSHTRTSFIFRSILFLFRFVLTPYAEIETTFHMLSDKYNDELHTKPLWDNTWELVFLVILIETTDCWLFVLSAHKILRNKSKNGRKWITVATIGPCFNCALKICSLIDSSPNNWICRIIKGKRLWKQFVCDKSRDAQWYIRRDVMIEWNYNFSFFCARSKMKKQRSEGGQGRREEPHKSMLHNVIIFFFVRCGMLVFWWPFLENAQEENVFSVPKHGIHDLDSYAVGCGYYFSLSTIQKLGSNFQHNRYQFSRCAYVFLNSNK